MLKLKARPFRFHQVSCFFRPWSVDSLNGGSTDELKKAAVEKKNWSEIGKILKFHILIGPQKGITP